MKIIRKIKNIKKEKTKINKEKALENDYNHYILECIVHAIETLIEFAH